MEYTRRINYYETDKMGIVHHSNYIRYFEEARIFLMDSFGLSYAETEKAGILIPVLGIDIKYKQPVTFGDELVIKAHISKFTGVKMTVDYKAYRKADMQLSTFGESTHCFLDSKTFKPIDLRKKNPEIYKVFQQITDELK